MSEEPGKVFEDGSAVSSRVTICNAKGLHARASAKFVRLAEQFNADIAVRRDEAMVGGTSIMGLMMLAAARGCDIEIAANGKEAGEAVAALTQLVADGFGENDPREGEG